MTKKVFVTLAALSLIVTPGQAKTATTPFVRAKTRKVPAGRAITLDSTADKDQIADFQKLGAIREPKVGEVLLDEEGTPVQIADSGKTAELKAAGGGDPAAAEKARLEAEELTNLQTRAAEIKAKVPKNAKADTIREAIAKREGEIAAEEERARQAGAANKAPSNTGTAKGESEAGNGSGSSEGGDDGSALV